jgi:hypothetical protein
MAKSTPVRPLRRGRSITPPEGPFAIPGFSSSFPTGYRQSANLQHRNLCYSAPPSLGPRSAFRQGKLVFFVDPHSRDHLILSAQAFVGPGPRVSSFNAVRDDARPKGTDGKYYMQVVAASMFSMAPARTRVSDEEVTTKNQATCH